jgi:hypothetical protein
MRDEKALALFQEILKKTEARKLPWKPTADAEKFVASMMGKYSLTLTSYTSQTNWGEPEGPPRLTLEDEKGNMLVEINDEIDGIEREEMDELVVFARRIALDADEKIDELLSELQKDDDIPF